MASSGSGGNTQTEMCSLCGNHFAPNELVIVEGNRICVLESLNETASSPAGWLTEIFVELRLSIVQQVVPRGYHLVICPGRIYVYYP